MCRCGLFECSDVLLGSMEAKNFLTRFITVRSAKKAFIYTEAYFVSCVC